MEEPRACLEQLGFVEERMIGVIADILQSTPGPGPSSSSRIMLLLSSVRGATEDGRTQTSITSGRTSILNAYHVPEEIRRSSCIRRSHPSTVSISCSATCSQPTPSLCPTRSSSAVTGTPTASPMLRTSCAEDGAVFSGVTHRVISRFFVRSLRAGYLASILKCAGGRTHELLGTKKAIPGVASIPRGFRLRP